MKKIIGIGNVLVDILVKIENDTVLDMFGLPKGTMHWLDQESFTSMSSYLNDSNAGKATGGSAGNTVLALANLGMRPALIGKAGSDDNGDFFIKSLSDKGVDMRIVSSHLPTGTACALISPDGERTFGNFMGAAATLQAEEVPADMLSGYDSLYVEGYLVQNKSLVRSVVELAKKAGMQVCLDLASYNVVQDNRDFFYELLRDYVDVVFANADEARALTGKEPEEALKVISELCDITVVKTGAAGSLVAMDGRIFAVPAERVHEVVDTTGAGDYYAAGFLYGISHNFGPERSAKIGSVLAGYVIQSIGATLSEKVWEEIKQIIKTVN